MLHLFYLLLVTYTPHLFSLIFIILAQTRITQGFAHNIGDIEFYILRLSVQFVIQFIKIFKFILFAKHRQHKVYQINIEKCKFKVRSVGSNIVAYIIDKALL